MSIEVDPGAVVPLQLQLECLPDSTVYVRAIVTDPNKNQLPSSPFTLVDQGNGFFCNYGLSMPDLPFISAQYEVFNDAAFTDPSDEFGLSTDIFTRKADVTITNPADAVLEAEVEVSDPLFAEICPAAILSGTLEKNELCGEVSPSETLLGCLDSSNLIGFIDCEV